MYDDNNKRKLYDALSEDYDMGEFEQFSSDVEDEGKRRKLYDAIKEDYDLPDFDGFSQQLIGNSSAQPAAEQTAMGIDPSEVQPQQSTEQPTEGQKPGLWRQMMDAMHYTPQTPVTIDEEDGWSVYGKNGNTKRGYDWDSEDPVIITLEDEKAEIEQKPGHKQSSIVYDQDFNPTPGDGFGIRSTSKPWYRPSSIRLGKGWADEKVSTNSGGVRMGSLVDDLYRLGESYWEAVRQGKGDTEEGHANAMTVGRYMRRYLDDLGIASDNESQQYVDDIRDILMTKAWERMVNNRCRDIARDVVAKLPQNTSEQNDYLQEAMYTNEVQDRLKDMAAYSGMSYEHLVQGFVMPAIVKEGKEKRNLDLTSEVRGIFRNEGFADQRTEQAELMKMMQQLVKPDVESAIDEAEMKGREAYADKNGEWKPLSFLVPGFGAAINEMIAERAKAEASDPDDVLSALMQDYTNLFTKMYGDEQFMGMVEEKARKKNITPGDYMTQYVIPNLDAAIAGQLNDSEVARKMPKNTFEYIVRGITMDSIAGMAWDWVANTSGHRAIEEQADAMTMQGQNPNMEAPGLLAQGARTGVTMAADWWAWKGWGKLGGKFTEKMVGEQIEKVMLQQGRTFQAARNIFTAEAARHLPARVFYNVITHTPQSMITMGGAEATGEFVRSLQHGDSVGDILTNTAETAISGAITGVGFGVVGGTWGGLLARTAGLGKAFGRLAQFGSEAATMSGIEFAEAAWNGEEPEHSFGESFVNSLVTLAFIKASGSPENTAKKLKALLQHPVKSAKKAGKWMVSKDEAMLTDADWEYIDSTFGGLSGIRGEKSASGGEEVGVNPPSAKELQEMQNRFARSVADPEVPYERNERIAKELDIQLPPPGLETRAEVVERGGKFVVRTRDYDGKCIREMEYTNRYEADAAVDKMRGDFDANETETLQSKTDEMGDVDYFIRSLDREYNAILDKEEGEELTDHEQDVKTLGENVNNVTAILQKIHNNEKLTDAEAKLYAVYVRAYLDYRDNGKMVALLREDYERENGLEEGALDKALEGFDTYDGAEMQMEADGEVSGVVDVGGGKYRTPAQQRIVDGYKESMRKKTAGRDNVGSMATAQQIRENRSAGYRATDEEMQEVREDMERKRAKVDDGIEWYVNDEKIVDGLDRDPIDTLRRLREFVDDGDISEEQLQMAVDYVNAKAQFEGMIDKVRDNIADEVSRANAAIDSRANKTDGKIHTATLPSKDNVDGRKVDIVGGDIVTDGNGVVDRAASSKDVIVRDPETGKVEFMGIYDIKEFGEVLDPAALKAQTKTEITNRMAKEAGDRIDGKLPFQAGDKYAVADENGNPHSVEIVGDYGNGVVEVRIDGREETQPMPKETLQEWSDRANQQLNAETPPVEAPSETPAQPKTQPEAPKTAAPEKVEHRATMPMTKDGKPDFDHSTPEQGHDYLYGEGAEMPEKMADNFVKANIEAASKNVDRLNKEIDDLSENPGADPSVIDKLRDLKNRLKEAQRKVDYWTKVQNRKAEGVASREAEAERVEAERKAADEKAAAERAEAERAEAERQRRAEEERKRNEELKQKKDEQYEQYERDNEEGTVGERGGLVKDEVSERSLSEYWRGALHVLGRYIGRRIRVVSGDYAKEKGYGGANGWYDHNDNTIYLIEEKITPKGLERFISGHEFTHVLKRDNNKKVWKAFVDAVEEAMGDEFKKQCDEVRETYDAFVDEYNADPKHKEKMSRLSDDDIREEVASNWAGEHMLTDVDAVQRVIDAAEKAGEDPVSLTRRVLNWINGKIKSLKAAIGRGEKVDEQLAALERAKDIWTNMLQVSVAKQNERAKAEVEHNQREKEAKKVDDLIEKIDKLQFDYSEQGRVEKESAERELEDAVRKMSNEELNSLKKRHKIPIPIVNREIERRKAQAEFDEGLRNQGDVREPVKNTKVKATDYTRKVTSSDDPGLAPMAGVYHDPSGYGVMTDGMVMVYDKNLYDPSHKGQSVATRKIVVNEDGKKRTIEKGETIGTRYPKWRQVISEDPGYKTMKVDTDDMLSFASGMEKRIKEGKVLEYGLMRMPDGTIIPIRIDILKRMAIAAKEMGLDELSFMEGGRAIQMRGKDKGVLAMPAYDISSYNAWFYEPKGEMVDSSARRKKLEKIVSKPSEIKHSLNERGLDADTDRGDVKFAVADNLGKEDTDKVVKDIMAVTGRSERVVRKWVKTEQSLAKIILDNDNVAFLDLQVDESVPSIWNNSDYPQGTVEFSNICKKRLPLTMIYQRLQKEFPNHVFDAKTLENIRGILKENGVDVACGLCFVEDRRQLLGEIGNGFIGMLKGENTDINDNQQKALDKLRETGDDYVPDLYELLTLDGMKKLRREHPSVAQAFIEYNNARGMQAGRLFQAYSAYHREILKYNKAKVRSINNNGGLRIFSFSDFEAHHLIDLVQVLTDCAAKGIKVQGYTKVPEFARAVKETRMKLNRSLIAKGKGYVDDGYVPAENEAVSPNVIDGKRLLLDTVEGIDVNHPDFFDSTDNKNVGNILVGINDEQIRMAMLDPFVNYIIPFHTGLSKDILKQKNIGDWVNYKLMQLEKVMGEDGKLKNAPGHGINIYTDVLPRGEELIGHDIRNARDFQMAFFKACEEKGYIPRFEKFINKNKKGEYVYTPGYEKLLLDFKLFDKNGKIAPQEAVQPIFDNELNKRILEEYVKGEKEKAPNDELYEKVKDGLGLSGDVKLSVSGGERRIQGLENYTERDIKDIVRSEIETKLEDNGIDDVEIKDIAIHGSRGRGTAREDSDLDVVVEYSGDWKEDSLFNVLNEEPVTIDGIRVDINPITRGKSGTMAEYMRRSDIYDRKVRQNEIIQRTNPMHDDIHLGIRSASDIKTFDEAYDEARREAEKGGYEEWAKYPDITNDMVEEARRTGEIVVYGSHPIEDGAFVTPSRMQAQDYAGEGKVYTKRVPLEDVAWINLDEGQYAKVEKEDSGSDKVNNADTMRMEDAESQEHDDVRFSIPSKREERERMNRVVDDAISFVTGKDVKTVRDERRTRERERKVHAKEIYEKVLSGEIDDVTLHQINDYINDVTPNNPYGRRLSERLPQRVERALYGRTPENAVDALFSRISESAVGKNERTRPSGRRAVEEKKKELLTAWAKATENWHTDLSDFTDEKEPIGSGTDSDVYLSKDGNHVVKMSKGKPYGKRFRPDIDNIPLFNYLFPNSAYHILGYGDFGKGFVRILEQPVVDFTMSTPLSEGERVDYMASLGFHPINDNNTAFSNGEIIVADLQKSNIVKDADGNITVIDADCKLHTKDVGGNYTYPQVEEDVTVPTEGDIKLSVSPKRDKEEVFVSNARRAVEGIKQDKATPEQWLAMIQKNGGMKAGEDKWLGLSDWLKGQDKKSLTKDEVLDYIRKNQVQIEEVEYQEDADVDYNPNMNALREEFLQMVEEGEEATNSIYISDHADWALEQMRDRYGDDFLEGFEWNKDRNGYPMLDPIMDWDGGISDAARYYLDIQDKPINSTRLDYTTDGLSNKREIALTVPTIEPWNENDDVHFGDAGEGRAVAWIRFGETTDADGNRVLVIDEIQSKRHQEGRDKGYKVSKEKADADMKAFLDRMREKYDYKPKDNWGEIFNEEELAELDRLNAQQNDAYFDTSAIPDAPFDKNWHELAMKRMLRYAAENGYDKVAWTKGEQQAERYNLAKVVRTIERKDNKNSKGARRFVLDMNGEDTVLFVDSEGNIITSDMFVDTAAGQKLSDFVGKEMAVQMMSMENGTVIDTNNVKVGGEGMKGFYDDILPRFVNKYGKKWGVKVGEVELPNVEEAGRHMWSVDVTPEMKESVMGGQVMFSISPKEDKAYKDAVDNGDMDTAAEMVKEAAREAGYEYFGLHGTRGEFTVFDRKRIGSANDEGWLGRGFYFWDKDNRTYAEQYAKGGNVMEVYLKAEEPYPISRDEMESLIKASDEHDIDTLDAFTEDLLNNGYDSVMDDSGQICVFNPEQIKSADPVTYDDNGNVIPLSERFNEYNDDIRFSVSPAKDTEYKDAVNNGDMKTAERMVKEAAKKAMPETKVVDENGEPMVVYHGTRYGNFNVFNHSKETTNSLASIGYWFSPIKDFGEKFASNDWRGSDEGQRKVSAYLNMGNPKVYETTPAAEIEAAEKRFGDIKRKATEIYDKYKSTLMGHEKFAFMEMVEEESNRLRFGWSRERNDDFWYNRLDEEGKTKVKGAVDDFLSAYNEYKKGKEEFDNEYRYTDAYEKFRTDIYKLAGKSPEDANVGGTGMALDNVEQVKEMYVNQLKERGYDGIVIKGTRYDAKSAGGVNDQYIVFDPNQIKSADPVTYDNEGRVIPLSERFNEGKDDIRFSVSGKPKGTEKENEALFDRAKKKFGVTNDMREAGYILPDGTMLDFSGRHELFGADDSGIRGRRTADHRTISSLAYEYDEEGNEVDTGVETDMPDFIERGAIRIDDNAGAINLSQKPTRAQAQVLRRLISRNDGEVTVEIGNGWDTQHYGEYDEGTRATKVLGDIDNYFDNGIKFSLPGERSDEFTEASEGYDAGERTADEQISSELMKLVAKNKEDNNLRRSALNAVYNDLKGLMQEMEGRPYEPWDDGRAVSGKVRHAASVQRTYDKKTVDRIVRLAKAMIDGGMYNGLSPYEVKRLMGMVNRAVGRQDISKQAEEVVDMLLQHQAKEWEALLKKQMKVKGSKVDSQGVEVQAGLDVKGQRMMAAMNEGIKLDKEGLDRRIADCTDRMGSDRKGVREFAEDEYTGLMLAKQYQEEIAKSRQEEAEMRDEMRKNKEYFAQMKEGESGDELKRIRQAEKEYMEEAKRTLRENRMERLEAYQRMAKAVGDQQTFGRNRAKEWVEAQKQRVAEIRHNANSDLEGWNDSMHDDTPKERNTFLQGLFAPLETANEMFRYLGGKHVNGEGYLWNRFVRGYVMASDNAWRGEKAQHDILDAKARELFGDKGVKRYSDLFTVMRKMPSMKIDVLEENNTRSVELTQGNLLYIYMVNKMQDGRMKLRRMGISEEDVANIVEHLDPRLVQMADWIQGEFLVNAREKYNATHERFYGAPMASIDNYITLKISKRGRGGEEKVENYDRGDELGSTVTGSVIKRTRNSLPIDLSTDALDLVLEHINKMEHWNAYAELNRDLQTLLSDRKFQNRLKHVDSLRFGKGEEFWDNFKRACAVLSDNFRSKGNDMKADRMITNIAKGVTGAKISFRYFTALKQLLSAPAFMGEASTVELAKATAHPKETWKWAKENLPGFAKRWESRQVGDTRLMDTDSDWDLWHKKMVEAFTREGMRANAFIDAVTVACGAKGVYETRLKEYRRQGYPEELAKQKALEMAAISYNESQQSSENAFTSAVQLDRSAMSTALTVFRNASMGYQRRLARSVDRMRAIYGGHGDEMKAFMAKQIQREWNEWKKENGETVVYDEDGKEIISAEAQRAAERMFSHAKWQHLSDAAMFGFILPFLWNLGPIATYLVLGNDGDKKLEMLKGAALHSLAGPIEGLAGGNVVSDIYNMKLSGGKLGDYEFNLLPLFSDLRNNFKKFESGEWRWVNDSLNLMIQAGFGVNLETFTNAIVGIIDAANGDLGLAKEAEIAAMRFINAPQSAIDEILIDELGMRGKDVQKMTFDEVAKRYINYKRWREAPIANLLYGKEDVKKAENRLLDGFTKKVQARMDELTTDEIIALVNGEDEKLSEEAGKKLKKQVAEMDFNDVVNLVDTSSGDVKKEAAKVVTRHMGGKDNYGRKPTDKTEYNREWKLAYQRLRTAKDIAEDIEIDNALKRAKDVGDKASEAKYQNQKDRLDDLRRLLGHGNDDEDIMKQIRELRQSFRNGSLQQ